MVLTRNQKKELVIKLYIEGKTTRDIAKEVRISLRDIGIIIREYNKSQSQSNCYNKRYAGIEQSPKRFGIYR